MQPSIKELTLGVGDLNQARERMESPMAGHGMLRSQPPCHKPGA